MSDYLIKYKEYWYVSWVTISTLPVFAVAGISLLAIANINTVCPK